MNNPVQPVPNENIFGIRVINLFNVDECQKIITSAIDSSWQGGTHSSGTGENKKNDEGGYRRVSMQTLPLGQDYWPLQTILRCIEQVNLSKYKFNITGFQTDIDFPTLLKYEEHNKGHYGWHTDMSGGFSTRKLTFTIQLSSHSEYEGCDLEFAPPQTSGFGSDATFESIRLAMRKQGSIIIFPSYLLHRVTPIIKGTRYAIVGWVHGSTFK